jgi:hypothetical protein
MNKNTKIKGQNAIKTYNTYGKAFNVQIADLVKYAEALQNELSEAKKQIEYLKEIKDNREIIKNLR